MLADPQAAGIRPDLVGGGPIGVVSESGLGGGAYVCSTRSDKSGIVAVRVVFIEVE